MAEQKATPIYDIKKVYIKDLSFEAPAAPQVFMEDAAEQPQIEVSVNVGHVKLGDAPMYEVVLKVSATAKTDDKTYFHVEVDQAGLFQISDIEEEQIPMLLEIASPTNLLPFAREVIAEQVAKGGFPTMMINPINFEALFRQKLEKAAADAPKKKN